MFYCILFFVTVVNVVYRGYVFSVLWGWFVVPLGVMAISIPWGIGLMLLLTSTNSYSRSKDSESIWSEFFMPLAGTTLFLVIGFIAHIFM